VTFTCTGVSQEDLCHDATFTYLVDLLTAPDASLKTINAVVYLLTAVIRNNGTCHVSFLAAVIMKHLYCARYMEALVAVSVQIVWVRANI